jgi:Protein of unknown function (DUF3108)
MNTSGFRSAVVWLGVLVAHLALLTWLVFAPPVWNPSAKRVEPVPVSIIASSPVPEVALATTALPVPPVRRSPRKVDSRLPASEQARPARPPQVDRTAPAPTSIESLSGGDEVGSALPPGRAVPAGVQSPDQAPITTPDQQTQPLLTSENQGQAREDDGPTLGFGPLFVRLGAREFSFIGYLNGNAVAKAIYRLERSAQEEYQASFQIQATGVTAWFWRGQRTDSSFGRLGAQGFVPTRMRQQQADKPAREQQVPDASLDLVSLVFQLSELGRQYPERLQSGFQGRIRVQKIGRVDIVRVQVLPSETVVLAGKSFLAVPLKLSDSSGTAEQIIWFVPERDWAPVRLSVPTGKYQVEFRSSEMAVIQPVIESP